MAKKEKKQTPKTEQAMQTGPVLDEAYARIKNILYVDPAIHSAWIREARELGRPLNYEEALNIALRIRPVCSDVFKTLKSAGLTTPKHFDALVKAALKKGGQLDFEEAKKAVEGIPADLAVGTGQVVDPDKPLTKEGLEKLGSSLEERPVTITAYSNFCKSFFFRQERDAFVNAAVAQGEQLNYEQTRTLFFKLQQEKKDLRKAELDIQDDGPETECAVCGKKFQPQSVIRLRDGKPVLFETGPLQGQPKRNGRWGINKAECDKFAIHIGECEDIAREAADKEGVRLYLMPHEQVEFEISKLTSAKSLVGKLGFESGGRGYSKPQHWHGVPGAHGRGDSREGDEFRPSGHTKGHGSKNHR
ncbi:MAG: hypothetical protein WCW87_00225 [Candidatus Paceibacterota bacterium]